MKRLFIKFLLHFNFLLAAVILPSDFIWSCGPMLATDESRFSLFRQGLDNDSGLRPFNYSEGLFNFMGSDPEEKDYKRNCAEWISFCGKEIKVADIYKVQYDMSPEEFLNTSWKESKEDLTKNTFIKWLLKKENHEVFDYMKLAKEAESTQYKNSEDPWDTSIIKTTVQCEEIALKATQALRKNLPIFLKERYAFQAIKMFYYSKSIKYGAAQLQKLYDQYLLRSKSIVSGWALVYYGMSQYNSNKKAAALLQAFDRTEEKKEFCYLQLSVNDLSKLEKITADKHLLLLISTVKAIKNKGRALDQIKNVYQYSPESRYLSLLITREINKLENWLWSPEMLYFPDNYRPEFEDYEKVNDSYRENLKIKDRKYLRELQIFVENIERKKSASNPFVKLALSHLYNMQNEFEKAQQTLQGINKISNPKLEIQKLIEEVITNAHLQDITEAGVKAKLAATIKKLIRLNPRLKMQMDSTNYSQWNNESFDKNDENLSQLFILLSHCFEKKGDFVTAALLYNKANMTVNRYDGIGDDTLAGYYNIAYLDRNASPKDIDRLISFKFKKGKTQFEQLIVPPIWGLDNLYKDLKGTILFRQKKYKEALSVFKTMPPDFWNKNYEYKNYLPLTTVTHTGKMVPSENSMPAKYTIVSKRLIVQDIVELQDRIAATKNREEKSLLYYKLANAFFNTSYNGKAWMMFSYGKSSRENYGRETGNYNWAWFNFYPNDIKYRNYYHRCTDAIDMYKKALSFTANEELSAKCLFSLAVCDRIQHDYDVNLLHGWSSKNRGYVPPYLKTLKSKYSSTSAFREAAIECPDVKNFLSIN